MTGWPSAWNSRPAWRWRSSAVLKAGAAYVPLDPEQPDDRLAYLIADSGVRVSITGRAPPGGTTETTPAADGPDTRRDRRRHPRRPRLRDLHLRDDRPPQGRGGAAPGGADLPVGRAGAVRDRGREGLRAAAVARLRLRRDDLLPVADDGRHPAPDPAEVDRSVAGPPRLPEDDPPTWPPWTWSSRRSCSSWAAKAVDARLGQRAGWALPGGEPLRPHRGHRRRDHLRGPARPERPGRPSRSAGRCRARGSTSSTSTCGPSRPG